MFRSAPSIDSFRDAHGENLEDISEPYSFGTLKIHKFHFKSVYPYQISFGIKILTKSRLS